MSPVSRGQALRIPSIDNVLHLLGLNHPSITFQLLITVGFIVLGFGSLETSTLLPIPLYSCWGAYKSVDISGGDLCKNVAFLGATPIKTTSKIWACGEDSWWQSTHWSGIVLAVVRAIIAICAGVGLDIFGRRRSAIAWMGVYFIFSFARSFAPKTEVFVISVTMEALSAQAATMALLLLASEGSTQKECVRSICLVLIGHAFGCSLFIPLINMSIKDEMIRQLAKSIPSIVFILFIFFLPESFRWIIARGKLEQIGPALKRSHDVVLEEAVRGKIATIYKEMQKCLAACRSRGNVVRQAVIPLIMSRPLWRIFFPVIFISFLFGSAIGFRHIHDTKPYQSVEDRVIACGVAELIALQLLGLLLSRLPVRRVLFSLAGVFTVVLLFTRGFRAAGYDLCVVDIIFSTGGHFVSVMLWIWLVVGVIRLTPTHSRGSMLGITMGFGTLGHSLNLLIYQSLTEKLDWSEYYVAILFGGLSVVGGLIGLFLPSTPSVLPDMTSHVEPHLHWSDDVTAETRIENGGRNEENTRL